MTIQMLKTRDRAAGTMRTTAPPRTRSRLRATAASWRARYPASASPARRRSSPTPTPAAHPVAGLPIARCAPTAGTPAPALQLLPTLPRHRSHLSTPTSCRARCGAWHPRSTPCAPRGRPQRVSRCPAPLRSHPPPGHSPGVERASSTGGRSRSAGRRDRGARARTADLHSEALSGAVEGCNIYDPQVDPRAYRRVCFCFSFFPCVPRRMGGYSGSLARPGGLLPVASSHCYSPMSTDLTGRSF